jgi:DNA-directed RNA polymerase specialized sigma24 family protein
VRGVVQLRAMRDIARGERGGADERRCLTDRGLRLPRTRARPRTGPPRLGGTLTVNGGEFIYMSPRPPGPTRAQVDGLAACSLKGCPADGLDPSVDFVRYRGPACKRFVAMARATGHHAFHDLDELAKDFYDDFWTEWLERPVRELPGSPVPYIAGAMMNKLRDLSRRGRSVRAPELVRSESDDILATIAADDLEPAEQVVLQEEMWLVNDIVHSLPAREQVVFAAVFGRDSKRQDAPPGGYKLAAAQLGVSEARAKKLSLAANRRIRAAVRQIESGNWCDRWASSIELVAAGHEGEEEFLRHAKHCAQCRLGVAHLRRQAAILPLPIVLSGHVGLVARIWNHASNTWSNARGQFANTLGRHANVANDASAMVTGGGGAAGAGVTVIKLGALCCLGVGLTGTGASVCLQAVGVPSPVIAAVSGSHHARKRHSAHDQVARIQLARSRAPQIVSLSNPSAALATTLPRGAASHRHHQSSLSSSGSRAQRSASAAQDEFNPGGGSGGQVSTGASEGSIDQDTAHSATVAPSAASGSHVALHRRSVSDNGGTVTSGSSNAFTAP